MDVCSDEAHTDEALKSPEASCFALRIVRFHALPSPRWGEGNREKGKEKKNEWIIVENE